jgi:replicative DNA helicase Mcm
MQKRLVEKLLGSWGDGVSNPLRPLGLTQDRLSRWKPASHKLPHGSSGTEPMTRCLVYYIQKGGRTMIEGDIDEVLKKCQLFLEQEYMSQALAKNDLKYHEIDFSKLLAFDIELSNNVLEDPAEMIKCFQLALQKINEEKGGYQIVFFNLPSTTQLSLSEVADQLDKFITVEGYVVRASDIMLKCYSAKFECPSCGNVINMLMLGREWKEPSKCSCGRKGYFKLLKRSFSKFQQIEIIEALEAVPDKVRKLVKKRVYASECLTRKEVSDQLQPGQRVKVHGFLDLEEIHHTNMRGKSSEFKTNIVANNLIVMDNSWESVKLSPYIISKIKEMAANPKLLDEFSQSLAPSFEGYELVRKSLILQHVGGKRILDQNGNLEERGVIHVLMSGGPGAGKTVLMRRSLIISPLWNWTTGNGVTKAGLVACVVRDDLGNMSLEVGPLVLADQGICAIDEMDKMNKDDFGILNNAMAEEQTKITKANIDQTLKTRTALLATSNPIHKVFNNRETILKQLAPIPKDILDRFDIIWAMRENIDNDKMEDKYMSRHMKGREKIKQIWSNEDMRYYIAYSRKIIPVLTPESAKAFKDRFKKLTGKTKAEEEDEGGISHRLRGNILRWAYAHAKFTGIGKENEEMEVPVREEDIAFAFGLIRYSFEMLGLISKDGFVRYEDLEDVPKKKEVNKFYIIKDVLKALSIEHNNSIPRTAIYAMAKDIPMDEVDVILGKLSLTGDVLERTKGLFSLI